MLKALLLDTKAQVQELERRQVGVKGGCEGRGRWDGSLCIDLDRLSFPFI